MNDSVTNITPAPENIELLVRRRIHELADHAPAAVRSIDTLVVRPFGPPSRRPRRRAAGIGATIAAVVGAIGITTVALNGAGSGGGATPEEAVQLLVDALQHEDLLGMIDVIDPAEVPAVRAAAEQVKSEAQRIDLVSDQFNLDGIAGVDIEFSDLKLQTQQVADDVAVVSATSGTVTTRFDPASFPYGDSLRQALDASPEDAATQSSVTLGAEGSQVRLATVERDGRWYVSLSYTLAELARSASDSPLPTELPAASRGFESPEAAVTALYERLAALDFEGLVATAAPGEGDALARYASLWVPNAAGWADRAHDSGYQLRVSGLTFETTGDGDRRSSSPTAFVIEGTIPASIGSSLDPTLPTAISLDSGAGWVMIPAGQALPATVDGLEVVPSPPFADYNYTSADSSGRVFQVPFAAADPEAPLPLRVERADGCTTWSGTGAATMQLPMFGASFEQVGVDAWRSCTNSLWAPGILFALGAGGGTELPSVATVEVDGQWYVSPLGTVAAAVLDALRNVPDGASLFDGPLALFLYGTDRSLMESIYVGRPLTEAEPSCRALFVVDASNTIVAVLDDPPPSLLRQCSGTGTSSQGVVTAVPVPASDLPPATWVEDSGID